jgi:sporulation protein YlmC with PRC-barrel domain
MRPLAMAQPGQMMASDLRGMNVYASNNENVGDIKDILLERDGRVAAMVIGVGGFLGIGEKNVALPFEAFDFTGRAPSASASGAATSTQRDPQTTGTVGGDRSAAPATSAAAGGQRGSMGTMKPERIVLKNMTKADLEAAPSFGQPGSASGSSSSAPARSGSDQGSGSRR